MGKCGHMKLSEAHYSIDIKSTKIIFKMRV